MSRMKNDLFRYLTSSGISKGWHPSDRASEKTEQRRIEKNRARLVWLSTGKRTDKQSGITKQIGKGTYIRKLHGRLKFDRQRDIN